MIKNVLLVALATSALSLSGCKFIKTEEIASNAAKSGEAGDDARIAALLTETYESKLLPYLNDRSVEMADLKQAFSGGLDQAGEAHGIRAGGEGGSWNFSIKGTGVVIDENRKSKAAKSKVDIDGDGKEDLVIQLGPVIKGTALRDIAPDLYDFSNFRDQIEFAKLGRALNAQATQSLPDGENGWVGKTITFLGAAAVRSASRAPLIVPVQVEISQ